MTTATSTAPTAYPSFYEAKGEYSYYRTLYGQIGNRYQFHWNGELWQCVKGRAEGRPFFKHNNGYYTPYRKLTTQAEGITQ
jgi:hypothetical protein